MELTDPAETPMSTENGKARRSLGIGLAVLVACLLTAVVFAVTMPDTTGGGTCSDDAQHVRDPGGLCYPVPSDWHALPPASEAVTSSVGNGTSGNVQAGTWEGHFDVGALADGPQAAADWLASSYPSLLGDDKGDVRKLDSHTFDVGSHPAATSSVEVTFPNGTTIYLRATVVELGDRHAYLFGTAPAGDASARTGVDEVHDGVAVTTG